MVDGSAMKSVALVTGASGGIGLEIARCFAKDGVDVVLAARSTERLLEIKKDFESQYGVGVHVCSVDLSVPVGVENLVDFVKSHGLQVEFLVNNAGFGDFGKFLKRSKKTAREMLELNISTLTELTHIFGSEMVKRGRGRILNLASLAAFQPSPYLAVYGASKAYVASFTEALHKELEGTGVTATVFSPGLVRTGFHDRAEMRSVLLLKAKFMSSEEVAKIGYRGMMKGQLHVVPGLSNKILAFLSAITPPGKLRLTIVAKLMERG